MLINIGIDLVRVCCRVHVGNELGAGNGKGARFATIVSSITSLVIGLFFWVLIMGLHDKFALIFTSSSVVLDAVDNLSVLLAFTILLNSIQPVLSGQRAAPHISLQKTGQITTSVPWAGSHNAAQLVPPMSHVTVGPVGCTKHY